MKKQYIKPAQRIVILNQCISLLAGSGDPDPEYDGPGDYIPR